MLNRLGWGGLALFKAALTVLVVALGLGVRRVNPRKAYRLLQAACGILLAVLAYHGLLLGEAAADPGPRRAIAQQRALRAVIEWKRAHQGAYTRKLDDLAGRIAAGKATLAQATEALDAFLKRDGYVPPAAHFTAFCPGLSPRACLAAHLVLEAGYLLRDRPAEAGRLLARLRREFAAYHPTLPAFALRWFPRTAWGPASEAPVLAGAGLGPAA